MRRVVLLCGLAACSFGGQSGRDGGLPGDGGTGDAGGAGDGGGGGVDARADASGDATCATELCNGFDDDCDALVDEDFVLGTACDGSDGDACAEGSVVCSSDGLATACDDATATAVEACAGGLDEDCDGYADCRDGPCCADGACSAGAYCCTGSGRIATVGNLCFDDHGMTGSSDDLEIYCCDGIARFCLSGEACPWRGGCVTTDDTCSRAGLPSDDMGTATCQRWRGQSGYFCGPDQRIYFP